MKYLLLLICSIACLFGQDELMGTWSGDFHILEFTKNGKLSIKHGKDGGYTLGKYSVEKDTIKISISTMPGVITEGNIKFKIDKDVLQFGDKLKFKRDILFKQRAEVDNFLRMFWTAGYTYQAGGYESDANSFGFYPRDVKILTGEIPYPNSNKSLDLLDKKIVSEFEGKGYKVLIIAPFKGTEGKLDKAIFVVASAKYSRFSYMRGSSLVYGEIESDVSGMKFDEIEKLVDNQNSPTR